MGDIPVPPVRKTLDRENREYERPQAENHQEIVRSMVTPENEPPNKYKQQLMGKKKDPV